jgi:hypothetical protein
MSFILSPSRSDMEKRDAFNRLGTLANTKPRKGLVASPAPKGLGYAPDQREITRLTKGRPVGLRRTALAMISCGFGLPHALGGVARLRCLSIGAR